MLEDSAYYCIRLYSFSVPSANLISISTVWKFDGGLNFSSTSSMIASESVFASKVKLSKIGMSVSIAALP